MTLFEVAPLAEYVDEVVNEAAKLSIACADGFFTLIDMLMEREPSMADRCGLLAERYEVFAIPLPDCNKRRMVVSIDVKDPAEARVVHGTVTSSKGYCDTGFRLATTQYGLIDPTRDAQDD